MDRLNKYADIFFGYTPRFQINDSDNGEYAILQPRDINPLVNSFFFDMATRIDGNIGGKYLLLKGDLLILAKGKNTPVMVINDDLPHIIASSAFVIIRTTSGKLDPYFLAWYLQQEATQTYLLSRKAGTTVLNLPIKVIQELQIPIPKNEEQFILGELYRERIKLRSIQQELIEKESRLMDIHFLQFLKRYTA
ncbi:MULTISPECIES: restriction endonuclease subunit S [Niastella]|uniref:Restriction endonuclease subunit S n=1 Tax=Niastella soli TaxID=2821487 RepID=A0ABS3Z3V4_9BACT|nr:restriction endonuclease subunit S [Niastella soli]MBO9204847.1 restriction endonuclease subunit S [Niastella soli]